MKTTAKWQVILGAVMAMGICGLATSFAADSSSDSLTFTIHVRNEAGVDAKTLQGAEKAATAIFERAGVSPRWVDAPLTAQNSHRASSQASDGLSDIWVSVIPRVMSDRLHLPAGVTGLAPGSGEDRVFAYVLYDRVQGLAERQAALKARGSISGWATAEQLLGAVIAHEIGHLLLSLQAHTKSGIMHGEWDLSDLEQVAYGYLVFSKQQNEVIRAEVARRIHQRDSSLVAEAEPTSVN